MNKFSSCLIALIDEVGKFTLIGNTLKRLKDVTYLQEGCHLQIIKNGLKVKI